MKTILKSIAATLVLGASFTSLKPLGETTAKVIAVAGGGATGALAGGATYLLIDKNMKNPSKAIVSSLAGLGAGGLSWFLLDRWLYSFTPPGRVLYATRVIKTVQHDLFISRAPKSEGDLIASATGRFGGSWPIVEARRHLINLSEFLDYARTNLTTALSEVSTDPHYTMLCTRCNELLVLIDPLKSSINNRLNVFINSKDYKFQVALYEKHLEAERQRTHESQLKREDRRHDRNERNKDRDLELYKLKHDSNERQKDRNFSSRENSKDRLHETVENYLDREVAREIFN